MRYVLCFFVFIGKGQANWSLVLRSFGLGFQTKKQLAFNEQAGRLVVAVVGCLLRCFER